MYALLKRSVLMTITLLLLTCVVYPLAVWVVGQIAFHQKANGSLILRNQVAIGSKLIGQNFQRPEYFHPRPSAAGDKGYDAANSSGSNLSLTNKKFIDGLKANISQVQKENPTLGLGKIPNNMVMASASGLDPDISPENALAQAPRVAQNRNVSLDHIKEVIAQHTEGPDLHFLGESHVNVLELNLALDNNSTIKNK
jgi:K+-transporting ATPase ATPase C chain